MFDPSNEHINLLLSVPSKQFGKFSRAKKVTWSDEPKQTSSHIDECIDQKLLSDLSDISPYKLYEELPSSPQKKQRKPNLLKQIVDCRQSEYTTEKLSETRSNQVSPSWSNTDSFSSLTSDLASDTTSDQMSVSEHMNNIENPPGSPTMSTDSAIDLTHDRLYGDPNYKADHYLQGELNMPSESSAMQFSTYSSQVMRNCTRESASFPGVSFGAHSKVTVTDKSRTADLRTKDSSKEIMKCVYRSQKKARVYDTFLEDAIQERSLRDLHIYPLICKNKTVTMQSPLNSPSVGESTDDIKEKSAPHSKVTITDKSPTANLKVKDSSKEVFKSVDRTTEKNNVYDSFLEDAIQERSLRDLHLDPSTCKNKTVPIKSPVNVPSMGEYTADNKEKSLNPRNLEYTADIKEKSLNPRNLTNKQRLSKLCASRPAATREKRFLKAAINRGRKGVESPPKSTIKNRANTFVSNWNERVAKSSTAAATVGSKELLPSTDSGRKKLYKKNSYTKFSSKDNSASSKLHSSLVESESMNLPPHSNTCSSSSSLDLTPVDVNYTGNILADVDLVKYTMTECTSYLHSTPNDKRDDAFKQLRISSFSSTEDAVKMKYGSKTKEFIANQSTHDSKNYTMSPMKNLSTSSKSRTCVDISSAKLTSLTSTEDEEKMNNICETKELIGNQTIHGDANYTVTPTEHQSVGSKGKTRVDISSFKHKTVDSPKDDEEVQSRVDTWEENERKNLYRKKYVSNIKRKYINIAKKTQDSKRLERKKVENDLEKEAVHTWYGSNDSDSSGAECSQSKKRRLKSPSDSDSSSSPWTVSLSKELWKRVVDCRVRIKDEVKSECLTPIDYGTGADVQKDSSSVNTSCHPYNYFPGTSQHCVSKEDNERDKSCSNTCLSEEDSSSEETSSDRKKYKLRSKRRKNKKSESEDNSVLKSNDDSDVNTFERKNINYKDNTVGYKDDGNEFSGSSYEEEESTVSLLGIAIDIIDPINVIEDDLLQSDGVKAVDNSNSDTVVLDLPLGTQVHSNTCQNDEKDMEDVPSGSANHNEDASVATIDSCASKATTCKEIDKAEVTAGVTLSDQCSKFRSPRKKTPDSGSKKYELRKNRKKVYVKSDCMQPIELLSEDDEVPVDNAKEHSQCSFTSIVDKSEVREGNTKEMPCTRSKDNSKGEKKFQSSVVADDSNDSKFFGLTDNAQLNSAAHPSVLHDSNDVNSSVNSEKCSCPRKKKRLKIKKSKTQSDSVEQDGHLLSFKNNKKRSCLTSASRNRISSKKKSCEKKVVNTRTCSLRRRTSTGSCNAAKTCIQRPSVEKVTIPNGTETCSIPIENIIFIDQLPLVSNNVDVVVINDNDPDNDNETSSGAATPAARNLVSNEPMDDRTCDYMCDFTIVSPYFKGKFGHESEPKEKAGHSGKAVECESSPASISTRSKANDETVAGNSNKEDEDEISGPSNDDGNKDSLVSSSDENTLNVETSENYPDVEIASQNSPKVEDASQNSSDVEDTSQNSSDVEDTSQNSSDVEDTLHNSFHVEDTLQNFPCVQHTSQNSPHVENSSQNSPKVEDMSQNSPEVENTPQSSSEVENTSQCSEVEDPSQNTLGDDSRQIGLSNLSVNRNSEKNTENSHLKTVANDSSCSSNMAMRSRFMVVRDDDETVPYVFRTTSGAHTNKPRCHDDTTNVFSDDEKTILESKCDGNEQELQGENVAGNTSVDFDDIVTFAKYLSMNCNELGMAKSESSNESDISERTTESDLSDDSEDVADNVINLLRATCEDIANNWDSPEEEDISSERKVGKRRFRYASSK